ncbi:MAG TPA: hypothetical protein ENG83_12525 [Nitrospirae bacterium]|nr:thiol:disulfide interchange protein DsbA precursor [bacterium BMS3Abin06]HDH13002.1 hypothetical protein [Nitrospirota bacterium]HDZ02926.1 hypothetical protein [Nitrospirota bacterium]
MKLNKIIAVLIFVLMASIFLSACTSEKPSIKGTYTELPGEKFKFDGKTVEVMEFLSFYCHTCYNFESSIPVIKGNFPKKIKWKIIPIYWGKGSPKPGEAYLLAEEAGKGKEMKKALFDAQMVQKRDIGNMEVLESIGTKLGLGPDFSSRLKAGDKTGEVQKGMDMAKAYNVDETPTLIIAGNIMVNPHSDDHNIDAFRGNVITILKSILQSP